MSVEVFCVETFWRRGQKLERGQLWQHGSADLARAHGQQQSTRRVGVAVYSIKGDPVSGIWQPRRIIAEYGDVPRLHTV